MKRFFGTKQKKKAGPPDPTLNDVSGNMDKRADELDKKIGRLEKQILEIKKKMQKSKGAAKNNLKRKALTLLKQKKQYETQRDRLMGQQMNIDNAKYATESMKDNIETMKAMKNTRDQLQKLTSKKEGIDIDEVMDIQDDMMDLMEDANEINDILGEAWGMDDFDEDDLLDELDGLDDELDDLDMNEEELPDNIYSMKGNNDQKEDNKDVDEYGLPKVPQQLMN